MDEGWYYHDGANAVGPITFDALAKHLRTTSDSGNVKVWHLRLQQWQAAKDVPQIADRVFRPPPLSKSQGEQESPSSDNSPPLPVRWWRESASNDGRDYHQGENNALQVKQPPKSSRNTEVAQPLSIQNGSKSGQQMSPRAICFVLIGYFVAAVAASLLIE